MILQPIPVLPIQQRLWFLQQLKLQGHDSIISAAYQVHKPLIPQQIQQRLHDIIDANDTLRLVVRASEHTFSQHIASHAGDGTLHVTSLKTSVQDVVDHHLQAHIDRVRQAFSDDTRDALFRVDLLVGTETCGLLIITASRLICDLDSLERIAACLLDPAQPMAHPDADFVSYTSENAEVGAGAAGADALRDALHVCELPLDWARPPVQQGDTARYVANLSPEARAHIAALARAQAVPEPVVLLAAYYALLYRYTLQDDILIGLAHRDSSSPPSLIGPLTDIAVIRQRFTDDMSVASLLASLKQSHDALGPDVPPFSVLLDALAPERNFSRGPVVQHGFAFQNLDTHPLSHLTHVARVYASPALQQLDVMLHLRTINGQISADWSYDVALFSHTTIRRMHRHYEALIASAAADAAERLARLALITPDEYHQIAVQWNETAAPIPDDDFIYRQFEKQAARTPDAIVAREQGRAITYDALNRRANRMAHDLAARGIAANTIVAILADRNIDYLTAMLAINKAGGAFLPLSPMYPPLRTASILTRSDSPLVLVGPNYIDAMRSAAAEMTSHQPAVIPIATLLERDHPETNLPARCDRFDLAYVIFTSGSTGEPKGVMLHHAGMINHEYSKIFDLAMVAADVMAQTARQSFDIMVWQFLTPLMVGASVYFMDDDTALDPLALLRATEANGITIMQLVPVVIEAVLDMAESLGSAVPPLKSLRWMVPTGEALHTDLCRRWLTLYPHAHLLNAYGATECSDDQCTHVIAEVPPAAYRPTVMSIGRPIINMQVYILDDALQLVPVGVIGELYIAGIGVGSGYLKDPDRTASTFIPNPFSDDPASRLYRSGDQARYLPDGTIEFLGRIGHMIKIRGMRIEPGEIQAVLVRHAQVAQATITVHDFPKSGPGLVAYVVFRDGEAVDEPDLRAYLRQHLPEYMIPQHTITLDAMPLNANGKIDRAALPALQDAGVERTIVAPRGALEVGVLDIWQRVLNRRDLSVHDDFFYVGGHSLLALRLFSHIERKFGRRLPLSTVFRATTIADQARLLADGDAPPLSHLSCVVPIQKGNGERPPLFCVHAGGGHVILYHALARLLGEDQPFYGIQAVGVDGTRPPLTRCEDLAAVYIEEMRAVQPEGPYYISGECLGGNLAFEMTRQLEAQGQTVALLVMFDSFCAGVAQLKPGVPRWLYELVFYVKHARALHLTRLNSAMWREKPRQMRAILQRTYLALRRIFLSRWPAAVNNADPLSVTQAALVEAEKAYRPGTITTPITLFNSELPWGVVDDQTLGWGSHTTGRVRVEQFPIVFDTMLDGAHINLVAERLRGILHDVHAAQRRHR